MNLIAELRRIKEVIKDSDKYMMELSEAATEAAIEAAAEATPPVKDDIRGVHTRTGALKASWREDSVKEPKKVGKAFVTHLKSNVQYASYVDQGHRMDKHFVPGLYINPYSGELEYDAQRKDKVGIVVGTRTEYVPGLFMTDKGADAFARVVESKGAKVLEDITG